MTSTSNVDDIGRFCVYDAPMALDADLSCTYGLHHRLARARNKRHIYNLRKSIVGPMPVGNFIDEVVGQPLDGDRSALLSAKNAFRSVPSTADTPEHIYEPLLRVLNKHTSFKSRCPGFVFKATARRSLRPTHPGYAKPHISCFSKRNVPVTQKLSHSSRSELGYAELIIQVTANATHDFFTDPPPSLEEERRGSFDFIAHHRNSTVREAISEAFELHIGFVTEVFARQHRNAFYSVSMTGSRARLFRWDRAGCIVSEAFDIREQPEHLCEFLWRFSRTTDALRGHDWTVLPATLEQEQQFRDVVKEYIRSQLEVDGEDLERALSQHYAPGHAALIKIHPHRRTLSQNNVWYFIVSRPVVLPLTLLGRGTRGYWAVEATTSRLVFLKDSWHIKLEGDVEGDILNHLNRLGVRNVPSLVTHGDVPDYIANDKHDVFSWQSTVTAKVARGSWKCRIAGQAISTTDVQRYRLVMGTVGYGLSTIRGTEELLHATYDAFTAMRDALAKSSLIHRDISVGNIILVREPGQEVRRGYLIDWETSDRVDDSGESVRAGRAGTWNFMSWRMLGHLQANSKQTFLDDMESLIHVVFYCALLYLPHRFAKEDLLGTLATYFEKCNDTVPESAHGGDVKFLAAHDRALIRKAGLASEALTEWLTTMLTFQRPPHLKDGNYGEQWNPEHVNAFWSEFLRTHALERDDRLVHDVTKTQYYDYTPPSSSSSSYLSSSPSPSPSPRKRSAEAGPSKEAPSPKRRRSQRLQASSAVAPPSILAAQDAFDGPRRSQRIKVIQSRAQPVPAAAVAAARAPRTAPMNARRATRGRGRGRSRR